MTTTAVAGPAAPAPGPTFLNGQESPTIEPAEADFNVLGAKMRGYHDFSVALQDPSAARVTKLKFAWRRGEVAEE